MGCKSNNNQQDFIAINTNTKKEEIFQINNQSSILKNQKKEEQTKHKNVEGIIRIRKQANEIGNRKMINKINKTNL